MMHGPSGTAKIYYATYGAEASLPVCARTSIMVQTRNRKYKVAKVAKVPKPIGTHQDLQRTQKWTSNNANSVRITRCMARDSARQAVFDTAELQEQVLLYVDFRTLWKCQGVCRQFQSVIQRSQKLQDMLLFKTSVAPHPTWQLQTWLRNGDVRDPIFVVLTKSVESERRPWPAPLQNMTPGNLCPLLKVAPAVFGYLQEGVVASAERLWGRPGEQVKFNFAPKLSRDAALRNVFVTDPPCCKAKITIVYKIGGLDWQTNGSIRLERTVVRADGLRLGDLVNMPLEMPGMVNWSLKGFRGSKEYKNPGRLLRNFEKRLRSQAELDLIATHFVLNDMVVPNEEEWKTVI